MSSQQLNKNCVIHRRHPRLCKPRGKAKDQYYCMFECIEVWLDKCLKSHSTCSKSVLPESQSSIVPTRLVDVGSVDPPQQPRLVKYQDSAELSHATKSARFPGYATLSYCWGQHCDVSFVLRQDNEARFLRNISFDTLPHSIRDAIHICRRIGIQCIWIDALCIQQCPNGEPLDWRKESTRVGIYYNNATVTIANAWATSNNLGCFPQSRWREEKSLFRTYASATADVVLDVIFLQDLSSFSQYDPRWDERWKRIAEEINHCPLTGRGWVAQEIAFSSRVLWFTKTGVYWQCKQHSTADRGGDFKHHTIASLTEQKVDEPTGENRLPNIQQAQWYRIIQYYAGMALSYERDRLPAVSGLAKFYEQNNDQYLAGLWRSSVRYGLAWHPNGIPIGGDRRAVCPPNADTPSWSWISRHDKISFFGILECHKSDCQIAEFMLEGADICLRYADVHGQITSASLRLRAATEELQIAYDEWCDIEVSRTSSRWAASLFDIKFDDAPFANPFRRHVPWAGTAVLLSHTCFVSDECKMDLICLLVVPVDEAKSIYRRVGILKVDYAHLKLRGRSFPQISDKMFGPDSVRDIVLI